MWSESNNQKIINLRDVQLIRNYYCCCWWSLKRIDYRVVTQMNKTWRWSVHLLGCRKRRWRWRRCACTAGDVVRCKMSCWTVRSQGIVMGITIHWQAGFGPQNTGQRCSCGQWKWLLSIPVEEEKEISVRPAKRLDLLNPSTSPICAVT